MRITRYAESLLHLLSAARHASDPNAVEFAIGELQPLIPRLPALEIEFRLWYAAAYVDAGQLEQAHQAIEYVRIAAQVMDNRGALNAVDRLASQLSDAQRSAGG
jgi:hypothetical protein